MAVGWPIVFAAFLWYPLLVYVFGGGPIGMSDVAWLAEGIIAISPALATALTLRGLDEPRSLPRSMFIMLVACWCVLAAAFAVATYRATVATFDQRLGRMPEDRRCDDDYVD